MESLSEPAPLSKQTHTLEFTGSASEYFRIWIVNVLLTILTLGIYYAWAKVRTRRYFYAHTSLDGHAFDYLGSPLDILKGHLVFAAGLIALVAAHPFGPVAQSAVALAYYAVIPFLIYQSWRYRLHHAAYRNVRMRFHGSVGESYGIYLWSALWIPLTLGLIFPYLHFRKKKYVFEHLAYGETQNHFGGKPWPFYAMYILIFIVLIVFSTIFVVAFNKMDGATRNSIKGNMDMINVLFQTSALAFILIVSCLQQHIYIQSNNYCWNHSALGHARFHSALRTWPLIGIRLTNTLAIIASLGLMIPWAKVRRARYIVSQLHVIVSGDLDELTAPRGRRGRAQSDASADFPGVAIGL